MTQPNYRSVMMKPGTSLRETFEVMNKTAMMIALVADEDRKLLGTITDGDIRRGLLNGMSLESPVESVMNRQAITVLSGTPRDEILSIMNLHRIAQIPLVDERGRVVGLELLADLVKGAEKVNTPVVIFAGGFGKRLHPLTSEIPKPMLPVGGRPLLELIIGRLAAQGFMDFHLTVYYKEEVIRKHIGDGSQLGVHVHYVQETEPLGTVGALRLIAGQFKEPILVLNGDLLTSVNFQHLLKFHLLGDQKLTIALKNYSYQIPYGVVKLNGETVVDLVEKPSQMNFISAGIYVVDPEILSLIPEKTAFDMPDLIRTAIAKGYPVAGFPIHEYWLDIGTRRDYERADNSFDQHFRKGDSI